MRRDIEIDNAPPDRKVAAKHFTLVYPDYIMKLSPGRFLKVMASLAVTALLNSSALAQDAKMREASVVALAGDARYSAGGGAFVPLAVGTKLNEGDAIKTGAGSHVDLDLGGNVGVMQLAPNSTFTVRTIRATRTPADVVTETDLDLKQGTLYFKVNRLAKAARFEISTPKGIAGIRGTAGSMTSDARLTLSEGMAGIAFPNNGGVDTFIVREKETVAPDDRPPHAAPDELIREIIEALRDAATHGIGRDIQPFVPPVEPFISPILPGN